MRASEEERIGFRSQVSDRGMLQAAPASPKSQQIHRMFVLSTKNQPARTGGPVARVRASVRRGIRRDKRGTTRESVEGVLRGSEQISPSGCTTSQGHAPGRNGSQCLYGGRRQRLSTRFLPDRFARVNHRGQPIPKPTGNRTTVVHSFQAAFSRLQGRSNKNVKTLRSATSFAEIARERIGEKGEESELDANVRNFTFGS